MWLIPRPADGELDRLEALIQAAKHVGRVEAIGSIRDAEEADVILDEARSALLAPAADEGIERISPPNVETEASLLGALAETSAPAETREPSPLSEGATMSVTSDGMVRFHFDIRVTVDEMAVWSPDRISAFFAGIAQAKRAVEGRQDGLNADKAGIVPNAERAPESPAVPSPPALSEPVS